MGVLGKRLTYQTTRAEEDLNRRKFSTGEISALFSNAHPGQWTGAYRRKFAKVLVA
jgi:hypothetical protein